MNMVLRLVWRTPHSSMGPSQPSLPLLTSHHCCCLLRAAQEAQGLYPYQLHTDTRVHTTLRA